MHGQTISTHPTKANATAAARAARAAIKARKVVGAKIEVYRADRGPNVYGWDVDIYSTSRMVIDEALSAIRRHNP